MDRLAPRPPRGVATRLPPGWPLFVLVGGYPLWWALGVSAFVWLIAAVPMLAFLLVHAQWVRVPRWFGIWILFLAWMFASSVSITGLYAGFTFAFRMLSYVSATVMFLYILNVPRDVLTTRRLVAIMVGFWVVLLVGGYVGLLLPQVSFRSLAEVVLPQSLLGSDYVYSLVHPRVSEVQDFIGYRISRPSAPFFYTNWWGGNFAALTPLVVAARTLTEDKRVRSTLDVLLVLAVVPIVLSVNRGVWFSLGIGLLYALARFVLRGHVRAASTVLGIVAIVGAMLLVGPFSKTFNDRLDNPASNRGRFAVMAAAVQGAQQSPVLGYGVPKRSPKHLRMPTVGTGGLLWQVLYTTGFPGAAAFVLWMVRLSLGSRGGTSVVRFWAHISVLIIIAQMVYYSMIPVELHVLMIAAALAWREGSAPEKTEPLSPDGRTAIRGLGRWSASRAGIRPGLVSP